MFARTVATTSAAGDFSTTFTVPAGTTTGAHSLTFVDVKAQYPVTTTYTLTP